jgi:eukaryotic-like serine/threonine-protein kinase
MGSVPGRNGAGMSPLLMNRLKRLVVEVHRRSLWQVLSIYMIGSWFGYQVILNLTQGIGLPAWVPGFAVVLFVIGLPIVLATAFVQDGLPSRHVEDARSDSASAPAPAAVTAPATERPPASGEDGRPRRDLWLLTWHRAIAAGIVAFLLLGITAGGYMGLRNAGIGPFGSLIAAGALDERERILIAEFATTPGAEDVGRALTQAFRVDLAQSPVVTVLEPAYTRAALERMQRDPTERVDAELAREIAVREGLKAIVAGDVSRAGQGYVLSVSLLSAGDGAPLASFRESASDSTAVLTALDRLSRRLRERMGESLRTVNAGERLAAVTTPSLDALRAYSEGVHALDVDQDPRLATALLEEAIAHDSTFGMAWRKLAVVYREHGVSRDRTIETATRAYELRDRMTPLEREHTTGLYHVVVTLDRPAAIAAFRAILRTHPDDNTAHNNLAIVYAQERRYDLAIEHLERSLELDSTRSIAFTNLAYRYHFAGRLDDVQPVLERYRERFGETRQYLRETLHLAASRGDFDRAAELAQRKLELHGDNPPARAGAAWILGDLAFRSGRLEDFRRHRETGYAADEQRGNARIGFFREIDRFWEDLELWHDTAGAERRLLRAVEEHPFDALPAVDRPYGALIFAFAALRQPDRVREVMDAFEASVPVEVRGDDVQRRARAERALAMAEERYDDALAQLRIVEPLAECQRCVAVNFAETFQRAGQADSAIARYEQFVTLPDARRIFRDWQLPFVHERLADLYADQGDDANAARHAAAFVALWDGADPALQPRVQAKRDWLSRYAGER